MAVSRIVVAMLVGFILGAPLNVVGDSDGGSGEYWSHQPPSTPVSEWPALGQVCFDLKGPVAVGQTVHLDLQTGGIDLQIDAVEEAPDMVLVSMVDGVLVTRTEPVDMQFLKGQVSSSQGGSFFATLSEEGWDGIVTFMDGNKTDLTPAGRTGNQVCSDEYPALPSVLNESASLAPKAASIPIKNIIFVDSKFYNRHGCVSCVSGNIYNRATNGHSSQTDATFSLYRTYASTSASTDSNFGIQGDDIQEIYNNWAVKTSQRTDKGQWNQATLMLGTGTPDFADGIAKKAGRYHAVMTDTSGHTTGTSAYYVYNGALLAHEMGHNFYADDEYTGTFYYTYKPSCSPLISVGLVDCIGYSSNCRGTELPITDSSGRPLCVGRSPDEISGTHFYLMAWDANHDPNNQVYWETTYSTTTEDSITSCLPNWNSLPYTVGSYSC